MHLCKVKEKILYGAKRVDEEEEERLIFTRLRGIYVQ